MGGYVGNGQVEWRAANWVLDAILEGVIARVAESRTDTLDSALRNALSSRYGSLRLERLTFEDRQILLRALRELYEQERAGPQEPEVAQEAFLTHFARLIEVVEAAG
jgi:xanthine/CO dehydrogenase XdhC/CoxF family maturation factor